MYYLRPRVHFQRLVSHAQYQKVVGVVGGLMICVAPNLLTVDKERSNYTQVLCEFYVPKNSFHMLPRVLKVYFESLDIAF